MKRKIVLSTVSSDSHMWNLVYLALFLQEQGYEVINLGPCTPVGLVVETVFDEQADAVLVSTVNGHGSNEAPLLARRLREAGWIGPVVIGGKLTTSGELSADQHLVLLEAGFDVVLQESDLAMLCGHLNPVLEVA